MAASGSCSFYSTEDIELDITATGETDVSTWTVALYLTKVGNPTVLHTWTVGTGIVLATLPTIGWVVTWAAADTDLDAGNYLLAFWRTDPGERSELGNYSVEVKVASATPP